MKTPTPVSGAVAEPTRIWSPSESRVIPPDERSPSDRVHPPMLPVSNWAVLPLNISPSIPGERSGGRGPPQAPLRRHRGEGVEPRRTLHEERDGEGRPGAAA